MSLVHQCGKSASRQSLQYRLPTHQRAQLILFKTLAVLTYMCILQGHCTMLFCHHAYSHDLASNVVVVPGAAIGCQQPATADISERRNGMLFVEASAKTSEGVAHIFEVVSAKLTAPQLPPSMTPAAESDEEADLNPTVTAAT